MNYRKLGRTRLAVSEIGLGRDISFTEEILQKAFSYGINCMDLYSPNPGLRSQIGQVLHNKREKLILQGHLCTVWENGQYKATRDINQVRFGFEDLLIRLKTDYIDIGMIHYVDSLKTWHEICDGEIMKYALEQKKIGKIRYIGLSSHNPVAALAAVESGLIDVLMFSVNPCYDLLPGEEGSENLWTDESYAKPLFNMDSDRKKLYETCSRLGVGITAMKVFGGGDLLTDDSPAGKALTVEQCIHYALTRPAVATAFVGAHSMQELIDSVAYESASEEEKDYASALSAFPKMSWKGHCMYCGHCAPCPQKIDIALVTKFLNLAQAQGRVPETVQEHYGALEHTAKDCIRCGQCEKRCPFDVLVRENMKKANVIFNK